MSEIDLRKAMNAVSDVVQNRPQPIRQFDQIYMKSGDMVMQTEFVARWASGKRLCFVGDGDAISVCVAYLNSLGIIGYGPEEVMVLDFDQRIVNAINKFAEDHRIRHLSARLYNVLEALPDDLPDFDRFYTNPPWGQYNDGASICVFMQRGMEALKYHGEGLLLIGDDREVPWTQEVIATVQKEAIGRMFHVTRMQPEMHQYHLDDAPTLRSCNLILRSVPSAKPMGKSEGITDPDRLNNFYGLSDVSANGTV
jgi:predicted methyltransferase